MPNAAKPGPETLSGLPKDAPEAAFDAAEASESTVRRLRGDPPALNAQLGEGLQSATPGALGLSGRKRRPSPDPGNGAETSDRDGSGSDPAGPPPLPRPSSPAALQRGPRRCLAASPRSAVQHRPWGRATPRRRKPSGTKSPR